MDFVGGVETEEVEVACLVEIVVLIEVSLHQSALSENILNTEQSEAFKEGVHCVVAPSSLAQVERHISVGAVDEVDHWVVPECPGVGHNLVALRRENNAVRVLLEEYELESEAHGTAPEGLQIDSHERCASCLSDRAGRDGEDDVLERGNRELGFRFEEEVVFMPEERAHCVVFCEYFEGHQLVGRVDVVDEPDGGLVVSALEIAEDVVPVVGESPPWLEQIHQVAFRRTEPPEDERIELVPNIHQVHVWLRVSLDCDVALVAGGADFHFSNVLVELERADEFRFEFDLLVRFVLVEHLGDLEDEEAPLAVSHENELVI